MISKASLEDIYCLSIIFKAMENIFNPKNTGKNKRQLTSKDINNV